MVIVDLVPNEKPKNSRLRTESATKVVVITWQVFPFHACFKLCCVRQTVAQRSGKTLAVRCFIPGN